MLLLLLKLLVLVLLRLLSQHMQYREEGGVQGRDSLSPRRRLNAHPAESALPLLLWIAADTLPHPDSAGGAGEPSQSWLPVDQIKHLLIEELGYEDQPEFEDALRGTFLDFLDNLLHATTKREGGRWAHTHTGATCMRQLN